MLYPGAYSQLVAYVRVEPWSPDSQLNSPPKNISVNIGNFLHMRTMSMKLFPWENSKRS